MTTTLRILTGCAAVAALAAGQSANPNDSAPMTKPARIEGVLLDDRYVRPLKRGYVVLKPTGTSGRAASGETDFAGKFVIENVEPGDYAIEARCDGFVPANWGRRGGIRMPRIFRVYAGQEIRDLTFRLEPWGALEGKIHFDDGDPANGLPVVLYRKQYYRGRMQYQPAGNARSNDRGEYRIAGLSPGAYIIAAIYNKPVQPKNPDADPNDIPATEPSYATTFYTSGLALNDAVPVKLDSGMELNGLDIFLRQVRAVRVKLRATDSCTGQLSTKATVQLYRMDESGLPVVPVNADILAVGGTFTIRGLGPGQYTIAASSDAQPPCNGPLRDRRNINIADYPLEGIELNLTSPIRAVFDVYGDAPGLSRSDASTYGFHLEARSGLPSGTITLEQQKSRPTQFAALLDAQEEYDLIIDRKLPNTYLKAPLRVDGSTRILIGTKGAALSGSVMNDKREPISGATVTLIPDPAKDNFQSYAESYSSEIGVFGINSLRPGKYLVVPWLDVPPCDFYNWDNLEGCRPFGSSVTLGEGDAKGLELVLKQNN